MYGAGVGIINLVEVHFRAALNTSTFKETSETSAFFWKVLMTEYS